MFAFRELVAPAHRRARRADHRRARQGGQRRRRRGRQGPGGRRVRLRHPAPAQGRVLGERVDRGGRRTRSGSRSAWWPASRRSTSPPWCRCGCSRSRSPAATRSCSSRRRRTRRRRCCSPSCWPRPGCPTACSTWCTATRSRSTRCSPTRASPRSASSARPRSPGTSTRPAPRRQAGAGPRRREEPHGRAARRRPRPRRRRRGVGRVRLGGGAVHGGLRRGRRRPGRRRAGRQDRRAGRRSCAVGPAATTAPRWARWSPGRTATGSPATSTRACGRARRSPWTAASTRSSAAGRRLLARPVACSTT